MSVDNRIHRWFKNFIQGALLGFIVDTGLGFLMSKETSLSSICMICLFTPAALASTTAGISYLARKKNYHADELEDLDKNLGKWMDVATLISSSVLTLLLASRITQAPLNYCLTTAVLACNLLHAGVTYYPVAP